MGQHTHPENLRAPRRRHRHTKTLGDVHITIKSRCWDVVEFSVATGTLVIVAAISVGADRALTSMFSH
jgi:hypothetical protein